MNNYRLGFLKKCLELAPHIRIQDFERTKFKGSDTKDLSHLFLGEIMSNSKEMYSTLLKHNQLLRYTIENDEVTEIKADLDFKLYDDNELNKNYNISLGRILYNKLKSKGINAQMYFSGGKGVHAHFLISTKGLNFKYKINHLTNDNFDKDLFDLANEERSNFKSKFWEWLDIEKDFKKFFNDNNINYDKHILDLGNMKSSKTMLTLEGASKRNKKNSYKTKINYNFSNIQILNYINSCNKPFVDTLNFFSQKYKLSESQIEEIFNSGVCKVSSTPNSNIINNILLEKKEEINNIIIKSDNIDIKKVILALIKLKENKKITSTNGDYNTYKFYCANIIKYYSLDNEELKNSLSLFSKMINLNVDIENTIKSLNKFDKNKFNFHSKIMDIHKEDYFKCYNEVLKNGA